MFTGVLCHARHPVPPRAAPGVHLSVASTGFAGFALADGLTTAVLRNEAHKMFTEQGYALSLRLT
jgi:hypothetical protein